MSLNSGACELSQEMVSTRRLLLQYRDHRRFFFVSLHCCIKMNKNVLSNAKMCQYS